MSAMVTEYRVEDLPDELAILIRVHPKSGCWVWQGPLLTGYGRYLGEPVHRIVYEYLVGPIPDKLTLDHVRDRGCITKACCWPAHLEPVTLAENLRRMTCRPRNTDSTTGAIPVTATKLRQTLMDTLNGVKIRAAHYEIRRNEAPAAVLVPCDWYAAAQAALAASEGRQ